MRHRIHGLEFNRFSSWRRATLRALLRSLFIYQSIKTTRTKAKAAKSLADSLISLAKNDTLVARREAFKILGQHSLVSLLFNDIAKRFNHQGGGYTRILSLGTRRGDSAEVALLELTQIKRREKKPPKKAKEVKAEETTERLKGHEVPREKPAEESRPTTETLTKEKPPIIKKVPTKKFLGGLRNIFKKERDSL